MNLKLNNSQIEKFSRQIILKNVGTEGQKKIIRSKVLIIGMGGLGCSVAEFLTRAGVGSLGIVDSDKVDLSNLHRQSLYDFQDIKKSKVYSNGGRVLNFVTKSKNLKESRNDLINLINDLNWENGYFRKDIGFKIFE